MTPDIAFQQNPHARSADERAAILASPGFGIYFTDHMFLAEWTPTGGWVDPRVVPYGPLSLDPATAVLHYAQEIFEGLKVYVHADGSVWGFRPEENAARMQRSAHRIALPQLPTELFLGAIRALVEADRAWVPAQEEESLYLRPYMFASEVFLGVRPAEHVTFGIIASPVGSYFKGGVQPVSIWLSETFNRAGKGGTGAAKFGGNYAASLLPQQEAYSHGCAQVAFLADDTWVEELGGMNLFFVHADGSIVTPELSGSILPGITRASIIQLARDRGHEVIERLVSIDEWRSGTADGSITEVFACGTAAVVTPVAELKWDGGSAPTGDGSAGKVTMALRQALVDIQYGRATDAHGWLTQLA